MSKPQPTQRDLIIQTATRLEVLEGEIKRLTAVVILGFDGMPPLTSEVRRISSRLEDLTKMIQNGNPNQKKMIEEVNDKVTFKWLTERVLLPLILPLIGMAIGAGLVLQYLSR